MSVRLAILDDGAFVRTMASEIRPVSATFHRFVESVARTGAFSAVSYVIPVRAQRIWEVEPALDPVDEDVLEVVPTAPFGGIVDYVTRLGYVTARNWPVIDTAVAQADLVWLRLPASNALLALAAARNHGVPHFAWIAGRAANVAASRSILGPFGSAGRALGAAYDAVTDLAASTGIRIELGDELFTSVVTEAEIAQTRAAARPSGDGTVRVAWAGRMAAEKGLADLVGALVLLSDQGRATTLVTVGDGPYRRVFESLASRLPADTVEDYGYVGDRPTYMSLLRTSDVFVHPSTAEGVPKAVIEAMAAGVPVVATDVGKVAAILGHGERGIVTRPRDPEGLAAAISAMLDDPTGTAAMRERALQWVADHTVDRQAERLVAHLRERLPNLKWPSPER